jgi:lincosamide nucleotidyltransferase A/C/D/E
MRVWLLGGWGIDALLREQTRPHKDLDIIVLVDEVVRMRALLARGGYRLKELWSENTWAEDWRGTEVPTAFVLRDPDGREIDAHAMRRDALGNGVPLWADAEWLTLTKEGLAGEGMIAGLTVRCFSPELQVICHTGYDLPDAHRLDLERLYERFEVGSPLERHRAGECDLRVG